MDAFEKKLSDVTIPIRSWCLDCKDFKDMLVNAERYGTSPDGVAALAVRQCVVPPVEHPTHNLDGTKLAYWETQVPTCKLGESKLKADAQRYIREHGFNETEL
jgi:hypothetical protein